MKEKIVQFKEGKKLNVIGDNQRVKLSSQDTNGAFVLIEQNNPAGISVPLHIHSRENEMFYIVEGEVEFTINDKTFVAVQGTTVYIPIGTPHGFKTIGKLNRVIIMAIPGGIEKMFEELDKLPAGPPDMNKVIEICTRYGISFVK